MKNTLWVHSSFLGYSLLNSLEKMKQLMATAKQSEVVGRRHQFLLHPLYKPLLSDNNERLKIKKLIVTVHF